MSDTDILSREETCNRLDNIYALLTSGDAAPLRVDSAQQRIDALSKSDAALRTQVKGMREALENACPKDGISIQHKNSHDTCAWCGSGPLWSHTAKEYVDHHDDDCAWVMARAALSGSPIASETKEWRVAWKDDFGEEQVAHPIDLDHAKTRVKSLREHGFKRSRLQFSIDGGKTWQDAEPTDKESK